MLTNNDIDLAGKETGAHKHSADLAQILLACASGNIQIIRPLQPNLLPLGSAKDALRAARLGHRQCKQILHENELARWELRERDAERERHHKAARGGEPHVTPASTPRQLMRPN